ncbi:hypothetical protein Nans01_32160 [Nocardiopsis ansamitocini]|uniref:DUF3592 domain-containing protein n=1 Tax=Nocardiopsis ansamitocini TaxID=1670832 RepID=A0A9W6P7E1_9ACTN|nr:hypothetical protein Nans01_32160 [Nocardiopsis ansamitocini]
MVWSARGSGPSYSRALDARHLSVLAAVAAPLLVAAVLLGFLMLSAYGPGGRWWATIGYVTAFCILAVSLLRGTPAFLPGALVFLAIGTTATAFENWVLADRGRVADCTVLDVDTRVVTLTRTDVDDYGFTTDTVHYDYRLDCLGGAPATLTTGSPAHRADRPLAVAYDPGGRVDPKPQAHVDIDSAWWAAGLIAASIIVGVGWTLCEKEPW